MLIVVASVQVDGRLAGQRSKWLQGVQRGGQKAVVAPVGRGGNRAQRDPCAVAGQGALAAQLATVYRAAARGLATAGRLGDAPVYGQVLQVQTELRS